MKRRVFLIEGLAFILIGAAFLFNSLSGLTGAVVFEEVKVSVSGVVGLIFVVVGLLVMMGGRGKSELENMTDSRGRPLVLSRRFMKAIKKLDQGRVKAALGKIGTGKGNEEFLVHDRHRSVRGEGKYRIIYDQNSDGTINVLDYSEFHK